MRALAVLLFCLCLSGAGRAQEQAKGWLGAEFQDVTKEEADALGWESPRGAKLVKPVPGGPAEKAGLLSGDILLSVDGVEAEAVAVSMPNKVGSLNLPNAHTTKTLVPSE